MLAINDGYTETLNSDIQYRRLLKPEQGLISSWIRQKQTAKAEEYLFKPPYIFADRVISEAEKQDLFIRLMENPAEESDTENLIWGVTLFSTNPRLAIRSCTLCKRWLFDEDTGLVAKTGSRHLLRPQHAPPLCDTTAQKQCPRGHHSNPKELSLRNNKALNHYLEWEGVGCPNPECPIVRRNWKWISRIFRKHGHPAVHGGVYQPADGSITQ